MPPVQACSVSIEAVERSLHDLCQPVTALQCRLEVGKMLGTDEAQRQAVCGALEESARIFTTVAVLREQIAALGREVREIGRDAWQ